jgi:hypothetical protein
MIPFSTAIWDPKWYHEFLGNDHVFIDSNGVINGIRIEYLNPVHNHASGCPCELKNYTECKFIKEYKSGLRKLDLKEVLSYIETTLKEASEILEIKNLKPVLIVHEADWNPCSERDSLIEYFKENNIDIEQLTY